MALCGHTFSSASLHSPFRSAAFVFLCANYTVFAGPFPSSLPFVSVIVAYQNLAAGLVGYCTGTRRKPAGKAPFFLVATPEKCCLPKSFSLTSL
jgi:biotin transporter BioY